MVLIYIIKNQTSGKQYIGITERDIKVRWKGHVDDSRKRKLTRPLCKAIKKYGPENFTMEVLYEAVDRRESNAVERGLIAAYGTMVPHGYNVSLGGEGIGKGYRHNAETCAKMSASRTGHATTEETKLKIGNSNRGKKHTEEYKRQRSLDFKNNPLIKENLKKATDAAALKNKGSKKSPEAIAKYVESRRANGGFQHKAETIVKLWNANPVGRSGVRGVHQIKNGKWSARISKSGKSKTIGTFDTLEQAADARMQAEKEFLESFDGTG